MPAPQNRNIYECQGNEHLENNVFSIISLLVMTTGLQKCCHSQSLDQI